MAVQLDPWGRYRGEFGPNARKSREEREHELQLLANSQDGKDSIVAVYKEANSIPLGQALQGTFLRQDMIPSILEYEYPAARAPVT